mmetsp:Transcript_2852/g.4601  ORF Transcript_2852/g.4601 Transcript_2852/m.4601 type:complete len:250 (-) Transcript_2852:1384-2133(-)
MRVIQVSRQLVSKLSGHPVVLNHGGGSILLQSPGLKLGHVGWFPSRHLNVVEHGNSAVHRMPKHSKQASSCSLREESIRFVQERGYDTTGQAGISKAHLGGSVNTCDRGGIDIDKRRSIFGSGTTWYLWVDNCNLGILGVSVSHSKLGGHDHSKAGSNDVLHRRTASLRNMEVDWNVLAVVRLPRVSEIIQIRQWDLISHQCHVSIARSTRLSISRRGSGHGSYSEWVGSSSSSSSAKSVRHQSSVASQ